MKTALERLLEIFVTQTAIAEALDITPQAVQQWEYIPAKHALEVERITDGKVTAKDVLEAVEAHRQARAG